jgi:hypothetical protein
MKVVEGQEANLLHFLLDAFATGEAPWEILAEPCAINTFDINPENASVRNEQ